MVTRLPETGAGLILFAIDGGNRSPADRDLNGSFRFRKDGGLKRGDAFISGRWTGWILSVSTVFSEKQGSDTAVSGAGHFFRFQSTFYSSFSLIHCIRHSSLTK